MRVNPKENKHRDFINDLPVSIEFNEVFVEIVGQSTVRDVPELDGAVLGAAGDDVVVERVPFDVGYGSTVPIHLTS